MFDQIKDVHAQNVAPSSVGDLDRSPTVH